MATNSQIPFIPQGETYVIPAAAAAPAGVQVPVYGRYEAQAKGQYRIVNASGNTVHLAWGNTATEAQTKAVAAVAGNPSETVVLVAGAVEILRFPADAFFSGLAPAGASTVYIVQGEGI
jgi:hypothetical protein